MDEDLRIVFESRNRQSCADRALVLAASSIPHQLIDDGHSAVLVVPAEHSARAVEQLQLYDEENPPIRPKRRKRVVYQDARPGVVGYFFVVCAVAWLAGYSIFGHNWFETGRIDGELIRNGEWWRTITALTLHADARHLVGNLVFGEDDAAADPAAIGAAVDDLVQRLRGRLGSRVERVTELDSLRNRDRELLAFALVGGCVASLAAPVQQAIIPELVPSSRLRNGVVLNGMQFNAARALGPGWSW